MSRTSAICLMLVLALGSSGRSEAASPSAREDMKAFAAMTTRAAATKPLGGVHVLGRQHLEEGTRALTEALVESGVDPSHIALFGKSYSEHPASVRSLHELSIRTQLTGQVSRLGHAVVGAIRLSGSSNPREQLAEQLQQELQRIPNDGSKILVIDDGGELIHLLHERFPHVLSRVVAVEQTRRGARVLEKMGDKLRIPVVDVAQSEAKLTYESPMIGRSIAKNAQRKLDELRAQGLTPGRRVLLVGYGAVGAAAARAFREAGYEVGAWDERPDALVAAHADGMHAYATKEEALGAADVIVSATGTTAIGPADLEHVKSGAILMNAASEQREIVPSPDQRDDRNVRVAEMRLHTRFAGRSIELGDAHNPSRMNIVLHTKSGAELLLLNDGYVINFDNQAHPTPARYIQLTMGLLYQGAVQAVTAPQRAAGLHALDGGKQKAWIEDVKSDLATRGESLEHPRF